jgi:hypothetical protein
MERHCLSVQSIIVNAQRSLLAAAMRRRHFHLSALILHRAAAGTLLSVHLGIGNHAGHRRGQACHQQQDQYTELAKRLHSLLAYLNGPLVIGAPQYHPNDRLKTRIISRNQDHKNTELAFSLRKSTVEQPRSTPSISIPTLYIDGPSTERYPVPAKRGGLGVRLMRAGWLRKR